MRIYLIVIYLYSIFWTIISTIGLVIESYNPDLPSYKSLNMNFLDPWHIGLLYGTSWNHFGGPYSIFWYWIMMGIYSLPISGTFVLFFISIMFNALLMEYKPKILWFYCPTITMFLIGFPQNVLVLFLLALGFFNKWFSIAGFIMKIPGIAPIYVWKFLLTSPQSLQDSSNWSIYAILIVWFLAPFFKKQLKELFPMQDLFHKNER